MSLASLDDINVHLPTDKLAVKEADDDYLQIDAERVIKGYFSNFFPPSTLAAWADPNSTPDEVRTIAGRLIAAKFYARAYSEDSTDIPAYAQQLYNEAIFTINQILAGKIILDAVIPAVTLNRLTSGDFWPNDSTGPPKFSLDLNH